MLPETRYASVGDSQVAYQVFGEGPDLVLAQGFVSHIDYRWDEPALARFLKRLASFCRVIMFDRRGSGASDPLPGGGTPSWEDWLDDVNSVLSAAGSDRTSILATNDAGPIALVFAATYPDRVASLILVNSAARASAAPDYEWGVPPEFGEAFLQGIEVMWGKEDGAFARLFAPSKADDPEFVRWMARMQRASMTPRRAAEMYHLVLGIDARHVLPLVRVPTLVVGYTDSAVVPVGNSEYLAEHIDGAELLVLQGGGSMTWLNEPDRFLAAIEEHVTGEHHIAEPDRVLATVLFTDIVGSTERATKLGDKEWRDVLDNHDRISGLEVDRYGGRLVKLTGDGILATFDGPARAIRAAAALRDGLSTHGVQLRIGLHAGEIEIRGDDVGGIAVHIAARVMSEADPGEVLVSGTVKGLVAGSDLIFSSRGTCVFKGLPDEWPLYALTSSA